MGAFGLVDELNEDVVARVNGKEAVIVAYFDVAWAKGAFVVGVLGVVDVAVVEFVEDFVDMVAADSEGRDEDQVEEEEAPKASKLDDVAFGHPELVYPVMGLIMAWQLQCLELFLHFELAQEEMVLELLALPMLENCQSSDQK